jgi:hypothetical protein
MIFTENFVSDKLPEDQTDLEFSKVDFISDEDFTIEDKIFQTLRKKYPDCNDHSTFSNDKLQKQHSISTGMIVDIEDLQVLCQSKSSSKSNSKPDSEEEEEEVILEWGFNDIFPSENENSRKKFSPSSKNKMSLTSSTSTAISNLQEEILNKIEVQNNSEYHQTFGVASLSSEENRRKFLDDIEDEFTAEKFKSEDQLFETPELMVTVKTNNNNHVNNNQVVSTVLKVIENIKNKSKTLIVPYTEINLDDPNLIDYYLSDFYSLNKKKKSQLTGKKLDDGSHVPPLPSEILEYFRRVKKNFILRFYHNPLPFRVGTKNFGYCFCVRSEKLNIDQYYSVNDSGQLPFAKLREYCCQAILLLIYPSTTKWIDLLKILKFKI